ncbi:MULTISPECIES: SCO6880 family protein [unclassified Leucobacter]|uniref:SCO6880 family protein n=1 Tax=unclassified Leucobacter TaxID=2621730 RepID=UPI0006221E68|nr:SCO6880 family protein [Leucobacter sp. Ag1]KKI16416.1 membrane protein [Leucobacter sp. Ag1]
MSSTSTPFELQTIQFSRLTRRGILLGLSLSQLIVVACALLIVVVALYTSGGAGLAWSSPAWLTLAAIAWVPVSGRKLIEWAPIITRWLMRTRTRQTRYRRRMIRPRPAGTLALPGDLAALREWHDPETGAAMIHDPHAQTLTVVLRVQHPAFVLLDPAEQQRRVTGWGRVLAAACRSGRIARIQVMERTLPDSGSGLAEWWRQHGTDDGSWAATTYRELIERAGPAGERHQTTISLALDLRAATRQIRSAGGGMAGAAAVLRQEMQSLQTALRSAELAFAGWLTPGDVALILRTAYDPAAGPALERHGALGRHLATAGPVAVNEAWDRLRSDSAHHAVLWISEWPRAQTFPGFLAPLVLNGGVLRSLSLHYLPVRADQAARDLRKKKTEMIADAAQRRKIGQVEDTQASAEFQDVLQQESELTGGHGILRVIGLVSVSAPTPGELDAAVAQIEQAAIQSSCETRRLVGQQAQAFTAAALPLCRSI